MATLGGGCTTKNNAFSGSEIWRTAIGEIHTFPSNGNITNVCAYSTTAAYAKIKIFRDNGANWDYIGQSAQFSIAANSSGGTSTDIDVLTGDLLCVAMRRQSGAGTLIEMNGNYDDPDNIWQYTSDVTSNVAKADGSGWAYCTAIAIQATYTVAESIPLKINIGDSWKELSAMKINIGDSWKEIVGIQQNIGDAWKTVF